MTLISVSAAERIPARPAVGRVEPAPSEGGTLGNERLTALAGALLLLPLAIIGVTLLRLHTLLWTHLFVGVLLIPPVALKLASTGYRFMRYYTHNATYRERGAPPATLRVLGPGLVITTVVVFVSGVLLLYVGPSSRSTLLPIHKVSFILWAMFFAVHVLAHLLELPGALRGDYAPASVAGPRLRGRDGRALALVGALVAGVVLAILVIPEFTAWTNWNAVFHLHGH
jgi:hypothetical protein